MSITNATVTGGGAVVAAGQALIAGPPGLDGNTILNGQGSPANKLGNNGDYYIDRTTLNVYGPKATGIWGRTVGSLQGVRGPRGSTILNGQGRPVNSLGLNGDFYIDITGLVFYGPRVGNAWPSTGRSLGTQIQSIAINPIDSSPISGHLIVTFTDGTYADAGSAIGPTGPTGPAGRNVSSATVNGSGHLLLSMSDSSSIDAGAVVGPAGPTGQTGPAPFSPVATWVTGTAYVVGPPASFVRQGTATYECLTAHTAGTFATDYSAGRWGLLVQDGPPGAGSGNVNGAASSTAGLPAVFGDTSGKLLASATATDIKTALGLASVATSGSYNDLANTPAIPSGTVQPSGSVADGDVAVFNGTSGNSIKSGGSFAVTQAAALIFNSQNFV